MAKTRRNRKSSQNPGHKVASAGPYQCHPNAKNRPTHGCLPVSILKRASDKLGLPTGTPITMRQQLEKKLDVQPNNEYSFVQGLPLNDKEKEYLTKTYLRPPQPEGWKDDPDMWLDSTNIEAVMKQYEEAYSDFEFMGPFPIDFAAPDPYEKGSEKHCLIREMCGLRVLDAQKRGIKKIGIIYNLDPHFKNGSHWVATYIDIAGKKCYYFDSYGYEPPGQIAKFMKWLTTQDKSIKLGYNARRFQYKGSECGMYSLYFIIRMIAGDNFRAFTRVAPRDSVMLDFRKWIFST